MKGCPHIHGEGMGGAQSLRLPTDHSRTRFAKRLVLGERKEIKRICRSVEEESCSVMATSAILSRSRPPVVVLRNVVGEVWPGGEVWPSGGGSGSAW